MAAAGGVFVNRLRFSINPPHVLDRSDDNDWLMAFTAMTQPEALRTPVERMLASVGCGGSAADSGSGDWSFTTPGCTAAEAARFTPAIAARVCRLLTHGLLTERFNAAAVLNAQLQCCQGQRAAAAYSTATLDALCVAAVSNAFIPQPENHAQAEPGRRIDLNAAGKAHVVAGLLRGASPLSELGVLHVAVTSLRVLALQLFSFGLQAAHDSDAAAGAAAVRSAVRLGVADSALLFAAQDTYQPGMWLPAEVAAALRVRGRTVALNVLAHMALHASGLTPRVRNWSRPLARARAAALAALNPASGAHPRVRGAAAVLLSNTLGDMPAKREAVNAGSLGWMLAVANDARMT
jgi:hypothetical protein